MDCTEPLSGVSKNSLAATQVDVKRTMTYSVLVNSLCWSMNIRSCSAKKVVPTPTTAKLVNAIAIYSYQCLTAAKSKCRATKIRESYIINIVINNH